MSNSYPLTPCQQLIWRSQVASPACPLFNQAVSVQLEPTTTPLQDARRWAQAWQDVQKQHIALSLSVSTDSQQSPSQQFTAQSTQLQAVPFANTNGNTRTQFKQWINQRTQHSLNPDKQLTDVAYLYEETDSGPGNAVLYLCAHHLVADAWSTVLIWQALEDYFHRTDPSSAPQQDPAASMQTLEAASRASEAVKLTSRTGTSRTYRDYLTDKRWKPEIASQPAANSESAAHTDSPPATRTASDTDTDTDTDSKTTSTPDSQLPAATAFYGHNISEPDTRSDRCCVPLSPHDRYTLSSHTLFEHSTSPVGSGVQQTALHLSALIIYLHKVTLDETIIVELPLLGRFGRVWMKIVGNFIEMIQVSVLISPDDTLKQIYHRTLNALIEQLKLAEPGCTARLKAQTVHAVLNVITARLDQSTNADGQTGNARTATADGVKASSEWADALAGTLTWHHPGHSDMRHPLRLHVADWNNTGIPTIELDINQAFFDSSVRQRVPAHLVASYRALSDKPDCPIKLLDLLAPTECWKLHGDFTRLDSAAIDHKERSQHEKAGGLLHQRIAAQAQRTPHSIAISESNRSISYTQLVDQANRVTRHLHRHGIGVGDRVAVYVPRSLEQPMLLLGVLSSGATYVPIDISQPRHRVAAILANAKVRAVIADKDVHVESGAELVLSTHALLDPGEKDKKNGPHSTSDSQRLTHRQFDTNTLAYIMYTSGSTGTPKGVRISHASLLSYLDWAQHFYQLPTPINMPLFTSIGFDLTVTSLFLPLLCGGTVHVYPQTQSTDALSLFSVIENPAINTIKLTPAHLSLLLESEKRLDNIQQLIVGGEDLKASTASAIQQRSIHPINIINEYGPTEATVGCIVHRYSPAQVAGSVPIGKPISGMSAYVLDAEGQPQFEGVTGELYLAGHSLAEGYHGDENQTATAFVLRPNIAADKLYRTGDLARIDNGQLMYLGRVDSQVSLNGYRVELAEIESALTQHPDVLHCAVQLRKASTKPLSHATAAQTYCSECGLPSSYPGSAIDDKGLCSLCRSYLPNRQRVASYFRNSDDLHHLISEIKARRRGQYDAVVLLSGGKDSTYALCQLVDMGLSVYAFSLDNGYLSEQALANIDAVCQKLNIDHYYARTRHMDAIFRDSLARYSNVCHGCFKTIYSLAMDFAKQHQINTIFTGLSRGQLFETRLNNELFSDQSIPLANIENMVVAARVQYHAIQDAPHQLLNLPTVNDGSLPASIDIVDFYRYQDVEMSDMLSYLKQRINWVRPPDTGRSTNCLINDVGIYVHQQEQGFHNYALPYSWDVRLGHKARNEALAELDDEIDINRVQGILTDIGYKLDTRNPASAQVEAYYTTVKPIDSQTLYRWLSDRLPGYMLPVSLHHLEKMPLNLHGKIDREQLSHASVHQSSSATNSHADVINQSLSSVEQQLADLWRPYVASDTIARDDNFFQLGGDSQAAIRCVMQLRKQGYDIEPAELFKKPVLSRFAALVQSAPRLADAKPATTSEKFSHLNEMQRQKLARLLGKQ